MARVLLHGFVNSAENCIPSVVSIRSADLVVKEMSHCVYQSHGCSLRYSHLVHLPQFWLLCGRVPVRRPNDTSGHEQTESNAVINFFALQNAVIVAVSEHIKRKLCKDSLVMLCNFVPLPATMWRVFNDIAITGCSYWLGYVFCAVVGKIPLTSVASRGSVKLNRDP
jgi:hypothetical protein